MTDQHAPGRLDVLRALINTYDVEDDRDELSGPEEATRWLAEFDLIGGDDVAIDLDAGGVEDLRLLREAFRDLLHAEGHGEDDAAAREHLNATTARARVQPRFAGQGSYTLGPRSTGLDAALGRLIAIAVEAMADGTWQRLKVCDNAGCAVAFYDHSRNRSGRWCSMAVCGNRMKVKAYRERSSNQ